MTKKERHESYLLVILEVVCGEVIFSCKLVFL